MLVQLGQWLLPSPEISMSVATMNIGMFNSNCGSQTCWMTSYCKIGGSEIFVDVIYIGTHQLGPQLVHSLVPQNCPILAGTDALASDLGSQDIADGSCDLVDHFLFERWLGGHWVVEVQNEDEWW